MDAGQRRVESCIKPGFWGGPKMSVRFWSKNTKKTEKYGEKMKIFHFFSLCSQIFLILHSEQASTRCSQCLSITHNRSITFFASHTHWKVQKTGLSGFWGPGPKGPKNGSSAGASELWDLYRISHNLFKQSTNSIKNIQFFLIKKPFYRSTFLRFQEASEKEPKNQGLWVCGFERSLDVHIIYL